MDALFYEVKCCFFVYKYSYNDTPLHCQEYAEAGTVKQNYVNILLMLLRLRQACGHPLLVSSSSWKSSVEVAKKLSYEKQTFLLHCLETPSAICRICNVSFSTRDHPSNSKAQLWIIGSLSVGI